MSEAIITINGQQLNKAQAMTVRVALSDFSLSISGSLGDDEHGKAMEAAYRARLDEIFRMFRP